jgi:hypothetical protein
LLDGRRVPSFLHEILVDLFRERPALAAELLRVCAGIQLPGVTAELASIDLSQVAPAEYRSDALSVLRDLTGAAAAAVIAEVQLGIDADKLRTWPLYVAAARARLGCPVTLLVLAPDPAVARWASQSIELGHPGFTLRPVVVGYGQIPRIREAAAARAAPELAVLSVMAHPELETAEAASAGLAELPEERQKLYWDLICSCLPELARRALEARMIKGYEYQSDFARKYFGQGVEQGLRRAIIALVCKRHPGLRAELEDRLREQPEARLMELLDELDGAHSEAAVRAVFDRHS